MAYTDLGIDLGTTSIIIYESGKGIVLREPSVVAVDNYTGKILRVGEEAFETIGKTPSRISAVRPLQQGVISDYKMTEAMVQYCIKKASKGLIVKPRVCICVPAQITAVESNAVVDSAIVAGARKVYLIGEPVAAALGAGVDIFEPRGNLILDIGGGTSDVVALSLGGIVLKSSLKVAGRSFDEDIIKYIRLQYGILIGERMAEQVKIAVGTVNPLAELKSFTVKGRNLVTGLPDKIEITSKELVPVLQETALEIINAVKEVIEQTPPELVGDFTNSGLVMTGGGSLLNGLDEMITKHLKIEARVAENAIDCVAIGTGLAFEHLDKMNTGSFDGLVCQH